MKADRAADRRDAERIAVTADARHHPADQMAGLRMLRRAEAQEIEAGDRPRPHGEDVAQDAADPGRRALVGLDEGGMVVALHLEDAGEPVADVDDAGVLARALDDPGRLGRQLAQVQAGRFIGAMLVPHRGDDAKLGERRRPADQLDETGIFLGREPMSDRQRLIDLRLVSPTSRLSSRPKICPRQRPRPRRSQLPLFPRPLAGEGPGVRGAA